MKKKLFIILVILGFAFTANAWTLSWDAVTGVDGYKLYWKSLADTSFVEVVDMELLHRIFADFSLKKNMN